jgi:hypothetical protein
MAPASEAILAYMLGAQDDDSYMLGDDSYVPAGDRYQFADWRFGKGGVPHPATCGTCGRKTEDDFVDPSYRVNRRHRDATATYDGYFMVSQRFVDIARAHGCDLDDFVALPGDRHFYWLHPRRALAFGARTERPCPTCQGFCDVIGPEPLFARDLAGPLAPGLYRSDLAFASAPLQGPIIVLGAETGEALRRAKLSGVELTPILAGAAP